MLLKVSDECPERTKLCFVAKAGSQKQVVNADVWPEDNFKCKHHTLESEVRSICAAEPKCTAYAISQYSACYVLRNDTDAVSSQLELPYDKLYSKRSALHTVGMRIQTEHIEGGTAVAQPTPMSSVSGRATATRNALHGSLNPISTDACTHLQQQAAFAVHRQLTLRAAPKS